MSESRASLRHVLAPDGSNAAFYRHCSEGRLAFQRCDDCGAWRHLPRIMCARCGSTRWSWQESSGRGSLYSWTVTHQAMHPAFATEVPYVVGVIEMEEGVRLVARVRVRPDELLLDLPVEVDFERLSEEISLPCFRRRAE